MAVGQRLRYEILRRDNYACRYCGATAPNTHLAVDHVTPVALGGSDDPENLVAACVDCNRGKASVSPDAETVADVHADALRWSRAIEAASARILEEREVIDGQLRNFREYWEAFSDAGAIFLPAAWHETVRTFLGRHLTFEQILDAVDIAMGNRRITNDRVWPYFCGVAWRRVDEIERVAREILDGSS